MEARLKALSIEMNNELVIYVIDEEENRPPNMRKPTSSNMKCI